MNAFWNFLDHVLGLAVDPKQLTFGQVSLRGVTVMIAALVMIRLGSKRSLAQKTVYDAVLLVVLSSMLARAINGSSPLFPTIGGGFVLVLLHRALGWVACRSHAFGVVVKGRPDVIVQNGEINWHNLLGNHVSKHDLEEDMRLNAKTEDLSEIRVARVERSGNISFIRREA